MCGIFGYAGPNCEAADLVFSGLKELEYRGYDSWGIALDKDGQVVTVKNTGKLRAAPEGMGQSALAIGHTRWATTGAVTHANAHPHSDCSGRLAIVHNGIVENYVELKEGLIARGKAYRVAMTACMRKLLVTLNQMVKANTHWDENLIPGEQP